MTDFVIPVVIDPTQAKRGAKGVRDELKQTEDVATRLGSTLKRAFAGISVAFAVRQLQLLTDTYTNLQNRLRTVTESQEQLAATTSELFDIANRTRSAYEGTAETYARVALAVKDLQITSEQTLQFTESLNQAIILSGASAAEAQAGLIQLSQGLASGTLRGDELRSVLEQLPAVADVISRGLGVTRGELRKLGEEGRINAEVVLGAFAQAREELNERFAKTIPTVGQAFVVLRNNIIEFLGGLDQATQTSARAAGAVIFLANNIQTFAVAAGVLAVGTLPAVISGLRTFTAQSKILQAVLGRGFFSPVTVGAAAAGAAIVALIDKINEYEQASLRATEQGERLALTGFARVGVEIRQVQDRIERLRAEVDRDALRGVVNPNAVRLLQQAETQLESLTRQQAALAAGTAKTTVQALEQEKALRALADAAARNIASIERENELLQLNARERDIQIELQKQIQALEAKGDARLDDAQRAALEAAIRLNQERREEAAVLDRLQGPLQAYETDVRALESLLKRGAISQETFRNEFARLTESLTGVSFEQLGLEQFASGLGTLDVSELSAFLEKLARAGEGGGLSAALGGAPAAPGGAAGPAAGTFGGGLTQAEQLQLQAQIFDDLAGAQQRYEEQVSALNALQAQGAITAEQYAIGMNNAAISLNTIGSSASTGLAAGFAQIENQLLSTGMLIEDMLVSGFQNAEDALVQFITTGELDFSKFIDSLIADLTRLAIRQALLAAIPGLGGAAAAAPAAGVPGRARGGPVRSGQEYLVGEEGPELFTPRQSGAITPAGETAAILQGRAAAAAPTVNVAAPAVTILNVADPNEVPRGIESPAGEQAILNVISKNKRAVRGSL